MEINYKNYYYYFLLPINLILVNLFSLNTQQLTQAQTTKPTVNQQQCVNNLVKEGLENDEAIVWCDYQEECLELSLDEGLPLYAAQNVCDCTIKEFRNRYTAEKFKELNQQAETDEEVKNNLREVGESCFEDILFAD